MAGVPLKYSTRNLWRRPARTLLTALGLALIVALIVFLTSFGRSIARSLRLPGDPSQLIVLSKKAQTFELSSISSAELDRMAGEVGDSVEAPVSFLADGEDFDLSGKTARVEILEHLKGEKIHVYKYKPKKTYRKKTGHRQARTRIKVLEVS